MDRMYDKMKNVDLSKIKSDRRQEMVVSEETKQIVNLIFTKLQAVFTASKYAWPNNDIVRAAKEQYLLGFVENSLTCINRIKIGLKRARLESKDGPFIPTVGQFISWCTPRPEDLNLPAPHVAYKEACRNVCDSRYNKANWSSQVIYHAASECGFYELKHLPEKDSFKLFKYNYSLAIETVLSGGELKPMPKALPEKPPGPRTKEAAKKAIDGLHAILGK